MKNLQPVVFLGHGSPMNAIADNSYTRSLQKLGQDLVPPKAILCISAHWQTDGTRITHMPRPRTIHDFHGFPKALHEVQYPAPGSPLIAEQIRDLIPLDFDDHEWGLDHGAWSVLRHIYPAANIPVLQLSMDRNQDALFHFELGKKLRILREQEILLMGSGNIVHNLQQIRWELDAEAFSWALEFDEWVTVALLAGNYSSLLADFTQDTIGRLSVPTTEHFDPMLYVLGAIHEHEQSTIKFIYEGMQNASISMRSFICG